MCSYCLLFCLLFLDCNDELQDNTMAAIADANEGNDELHENNLMTDEGNCLFVYLPY